MESKNDLQNVQEVLDKYLNLTDYAEIYTELVMNRDLIKLPEGIEILIRQVRHHNQQVKSKHNLQRRINAVIALSAIGEAAIVALPVLNQVLLDESEDILLRVMCDDTIQGIGQISIAKSRESSMDAPRAKTPKTFTAPRKVVQEHNTARVSGNSPIRKSKAVKVV